ncbi:MAG: HAD family phosphatase [Ruminococcus sp.]|nr:HAD family phosphatase [Ruminococcus sp.]
MEFSKIKGIIFDLDGTLIDSSHVWSDIDIMFLAKRGFEVPDDYFKMVSTMNFTQAAVYTIERFNLDEKVEDICAEWHDMAYDEYAHHIKLKAGVYDFLHKLKENNLKIALATASSKELYEAVLKNNGVYELFDFFASTNDVKRGKGFPDVYEHACKGLGLTPSECVVFEDIIEGITAAKSANFTAIACLDEHYIHDWEKMKALADHSFTDFNTLTI